MIELLLFAGFSASASAPKTLPSASAPAAACQVVTHDEVQRAFHRPFAAASQEINSCEYSALEQQVVAIKMQHSIPKLDLKAEVLTLRKAFPDARVRDAAGFRSPAFFLDLPGIGTQLFVIRGEHDFLLVSVMGLGEAKRVSAGALQIAHRAIDRLPSAP